MRTYDKAWFHAATPDLAKGLRGGVATLVPFYLATRLGRHEFAWLALGGWLGTLVDPGGLRSTRAKTLTAFAAVGGVAVALSEHLSTSAWLTALGLFLTAFPASLLRSLGAVWASAGTMILIVVAIGSAQGGSTPLLDGSFFAAGAGFAVLLSSVIWPIWTHLPLRRAEASVFEALAHYATEIESCARARTPEGDARWVELARVHHRQIRVALEDARRLALGGRARRAGETRLGGNLRILLGLAESEFPLLITLKETSELDSSDQSSLEVQGRLRALARLNLETAAILRTRSLRAHDMQPSIPPPGGAVGAQSSLVALLTHLEDESRTAHALASSLDARGDTPTLGDTSDPGKQSVRPTARDWLARSRGDLATLRDACSPRSTFFHHGLRVSCTVAIASLIGARISLHPHWVTVTTLAVLQPYSGATATRAAQRVLGTVLGSLLAVLITMTLRSPLLLSAIMFPLSVAAVATHRRNYRLFTFFLTPVFVLLSERFHGDWWTAAARASDAAVGGALALVAAVLIFPSRERTRLPELLSRMLEALANYAVAVLGETADRHREPANARVLAARRDAGITLAAAEDSLERLLTEPRKDDSSGEYALQLITYGRRTASTLTTLDTYSDRDLTRQAALDTDLARAVELYVVSALRQTAAFTRGVSAQSEAPVPTLPTGLEAHLSAILARLLRCCKLISEVSRGDLRAPPYAADGEGDPLRMRRHREPQT